MIFDRIKSKKIMRALSLLMVLCLVMAFFIAPAKADTEPNDSFANAVEITEGTYQGTLNQTDQYDYYNITLEPSDIIHIEFTSDATDGQRIWLYEPDNSTEAFDLSCSQGANKTDKYVLANETSTASWHIEVEGPSGWDYSGNYSFTVTISSQNDAGTGHDVASSPGDAYEVQDGETSGMLMDLDSMDIYKVWLEPGSIIDIEFTSDAADGQEIHFNEPDGTTNVFFFSASQGLTNSEEYVLANETQADYWYISIKGPSGWDFEGNYSFTVTISSQNDAGSGHDVASAFSEAYEIQDGESTGMLKDLDTEDMYKIWLESGSKVQIEFTSDATDGQELELYDPNQDPKEKVESSQGSVATTEEYVLANETQAAYWYIEVRGPSGWDFPGNYSLTAMVSSQNDAGSGGDVAASFDDSYEVQEGEYTGLLDDEDTADMYKIWLEPSSKIQVEFTCDAADGQELEIYNPSREPQGFVDSSGSSIVTTEQHVLANETQAAYWYIEVRGPSGWDYSGNYSFTTMIDSQNDAGSGGDVASSFDDAYEVQEGQFNGILEDLDEEDMYKVWLNSSSVIELEFWSESVDGQELTLYDSNRESVFSLSSSENATRTDDHTVPSGADAAYWYIGIEKGIGDWSGDYTFNVTIETQEPEFEFANLRADPSEVGIDDQFELKIDVSNVGTAAGEYEVEFFVDGTSVGTDTVNVDIDETVTASITHSEDTAGNYTVEAEDLTAEFEVTEGGGLDPAEFEFSNLTVDPTIVTGSGDFDISIDVKNIGEETGEYTVQFKVDGENVGSDTVTVPAGETRTAGITYSTNKTGSHTVTAEDQEASFEVIDEPDPEGFFEDLFAMGMLCLALVIIVPIIIIVIIIVVVVKLLGSDEEEEYQQGPPPQQQEYGLYDDEEENPPPPE